MRTYVQPGQVVTVTAPSGGAVAGRGVLIGTLFGVALHDAAQGDPVEIQTEGVVDIAKVSALEITAGARVFWVPASNNVNVTATSQVNVGVALVTAANPSPTVRIKLGAVTPSGT